MNGRVKPTNQGFNDLHTPLGFFVIGCCFILLTFIIAVGSIIAKQIAAKERLVRDKLHEEQKRKAEEP